jgi:glyoxylase-like metal-dependent hydrolase (beta-lactamase superfamily II)
MTSTNIACAPLKWKLLTKKRGSSTQGLPPGKEALAWVSGTATLIYGERDAILVDTFLSEQQSKELVEWVAESGKNLTTIYVTHAHGDHFFGLKLLLDRFPNAKAVTSPAIAEGIRKQVDPEFIKTFWETRFPGLIPKELVVPDVLEGNKLELEGQKLVVVQLGHTDTANTTCLYVPSIDLVVSGDCVYNNTHPYLAECDAAARDEWLAALDKIESLHPRAVVAGHGALDPDSDPKHIEETRQYILNFNKLLQSTARARDLYDAMLALYPDRINPGSLWAAANAAKPS